MSHAQSTTGWCSEIEGAENSKLEAGNHREKFSDRIYRILLDLFFPKSAAEKRVNPVNPV
jgi:hypothetical protein